MSEAVTIDNYDVATHERYAVDKESYHAHFLIDASEIPRHSNLALTESSILSKWEELFETNELRHPFAAFAPPPGYASMRNRFFSHAVSPEFDWTEEEDEDEQEKEEQRYVEAYKERIRKKRSKLMPIALLEKDRDALLNLFDSIQLLNGYLREIHGRKLQYQKG